MARIKVDIPEKILLTVKLPVRITDINYGNHLGNDALISIIHEARVLWLKEGNYTELNIGNAALIMSDLAVEYKSEAFYGDELSVAISVGDVGRVNFDIYFLVTNQHYKVIAKAKTGMVCYDYTAKKVAQLPEGFKRFLEK
ncbi:thioesterase family protein [Ferruginibacter sp. HRS2-29]|uniref:acyl-CoA thioesterase n=1 Tax=Ferruginibacter sp. HRS2-29 TaxID=2487334 RepID=UPI0020CCE4F9|nr:thioesterase family protein [Ferruginibacter sp. HRS2-29]MCP9753322.1 thioesterase [Ferruginibacter sp. HRS2-29]